MTITDNGDGIPYGVYARLILMYIMTQAVITKSRNVELGSVRSLCKSLLIIGSSGKINDAIKEQVGRIADCTITIQYSGDDAFNMFDDGMVLSEAFYEHLTKSAVPIDYDVYSALRRSLISADLFVWLSHRLPHISQKKPLVKIPMLKIAEQFGSEYARFIDFVDAFSKALKTVQVFYSVANAGVKEGDLYLYHSPPHVFRGLERQNSRTC